MKMKKEISILLIIGLVFWNSSCDKSEESNIDVEAEIISEMDSQQITSVSACINKNDEIAWEGTFGHKDAALIQPTDRNTLYTIMSIGKLVLATAVMQLWEEERIDLDADINDYLSFDVRNPNFPNNKITPNMLLNHTSSLAWPADDDGIPDFHHFYSLEEPPYIKDWLPQYILPEGNQYRTTVWKDFAPSEQFLYSNIGASLLGLVVEEITGMDYRDYCKLNIFELLDMDNTAFRLSELDEENMVQPYYDNGSPMHYYTSRHYPAGFISTDIEDFSKFVIAMLNKGAYNGNRILEESTFEKMIDLQDSTSGTANLWVHCLGDCIGHLGGGTGFSTWVEWHFEKDRALFIFSNKVNSSISPKGRIYELVKYQAYKY